MKCKHGVLRSFVRRIDLARKMIVIRCATCGKVVRIDRSGLENIEFIVNEKRAFPIEEQSFLLIRSIRKLFARITKFYKLRYQLVVFRRTGALIDSDRRIIVIPQKCSLQTLIHEIAHALLFRRTGSVGHNDQHIETMKEIRDLILQKGWTDTSDFLSIVSWIGEGSSNELAIGSDGLTIHIHECKTAN